MPSFEGARERAAQVRAGLARPLALAGRLLLAAAVVAGGVALVHLGERHLRTAGTFSITELTVTGNEHLSREDVLAAAGLAVGKNVLARTPEQVVASLEANAWIASATAERRLPGTWRLTVSEHVALAVLSIEAGCPVDPAGTDEARDEEVRDPGEPRPCDGGLYLLSRDGVPFKAVGERDVVDYPIVTGLPFDRFREEPLWREQTLLEVTALLHDWETVSLGNESRLEEVHVEEDGGLTVVVGDEGTLVRLGDPPHRPKLRRLDRVLTALASRRADPEYVLLDDPRHPDRATVGVRE